MPPAPDFFWTDLFDSLVLEGLAKAVNPDSTFTDTEIILSLLRRVKRRIRTDRLAHELTLALSVVLIVPIVLKIWDFYSPLQFRTITTGAAICAVLFVAYTMWRLVPKETLDQAAVSVDSRADLYDQMTTASWFITNGLWSDWIEAQFRGAAQTATNIDLRRLYPRVIPRVSYVAAAMIVLFAGLNFIPLSLNHNWLKLQAAPAGVPPAANDFLQNIKDGLEQMAKDLQQAEQTKETAAALLRKELQKAADELRKLARQVGNGKPESAESMEQTQRSLQQASRNSKPGLERLSKSLAQASEGLKNKNQQAAKDGLQQAADDLESLEQKMQQQASRDQTGQPRQTAQEANRSGAEGDQRQKRQQSGQRGRSNEKKSDSENLGAGEDPNGQAPRNGAPATLEVELEQERVAAMPSGGSVPEDIDEISKQQLSKLDYRNIKSQLNATQKDLLNQEGVPWEYRPLIKNYFQAIRPR